jgi:hypothetical protein
LTSVCCLLCNAILSLGLMLQNHDRLNPMIKAVVDGRAIADAIAELKTIDPKLYTALRAELRTGLGGPAKAVENAWPASSPLSGMNNNGRTAYQPIKTSVSFLPGRARGGKVSTLIGITAKVPKERVGGWIGEMAGIRNKYTSGDSRTYSKNGMSADSKGNPYKHKKNGQGEALVQALNQKYGTADRGGRWGWRKFVNMKSNIQSIGINILENTVTKLNRGN